MGYEYIKRLSSLKKQTDDSLQGRIGFGRAFILCLVALSLVAFLLQTPPPEVGDGRLPLDRIKESDTDRVIRRLYPGRSLEEIDTPEQARRKALDSWRDETREAIESRVAWLENSPLGVDGGERYLNYADFVITAVIGDTGGRSTDDALSFDYYVGGFNQGLVSMLLRGGFVFIAAWPVWLLAVVAGYFGFRAIFKPRKTTDFLGVCDPGHGPFYSGVWAPLQPNGGMSGTDFSCPSLACPSQVRPSVVAKHSLGHLLKKYGAANETNIGLARIVLAYRDYPSLVEEERSEDDSQEFSPLHQPSAVQQQTGIVTSGEFNLVKSATIGLRAVLEAHQALRRYEKTASQVPLGQETDPAFDQHREVIEQLAQGLTPLAGTLLRALTPARARALAALPTTLVVSSYLAIEAGKSLVFKRVKGGFTAISQFPHLQARAVIQSLPSYHREYSGDQRLIMRQAVVCSRRHGDFGRALLPVSMPTGSRALREWLEILYTAPERRIETSHLTELDAHLEEIYENWCRQFSERLKAQARAENDGAVTVNVWKGIPFKSVVLVPLISVINLSLKGVSASRQRRIFELIELTRAKQSSLSISARLPGFKRQAIEAAKESGAASGVSKILTESAGGKELLSKWMIVRRVLTRYNWLSTRVGDDAVPTDGLVQAVVILRDETGPPEVVGHDALVPLRERRFKQLLSADWERKYYATAPHPDDIEAFTDTDEFDATLKQRLKEAKDGTLSGPPSNDMGNLASA